MADQLTLSQSGESLIGFCIPKMETPQPVLPYSSGQNSLTERPQILGRRASCVLLLPVAPRRAATASSRLLSCRLMGKLSPRRRFDQQAWLADDLFTRNKARPDICTYPSHSTQASFYTIVLTYSLDMLH